MGKFDVDEMEWVLGRAKMKQTPGPGNLQIEFIKWADKETKMEIHQIIITCYENKQIIENIDKASYRSYIQKRNPKHTKQLQTNSPTRLNIQNIRSNAKSQI